MYLTIPYNFLPPHLLPCCLTPSPVVLHLGCLFLVELECFHQPLSPPQGISCPLLRERYLTSRRLACNLREATSHFQSTSLRGSYMYIHRFEANHIHRSSVRLLVLKSNFFHLLMCPLSPTPFIPPSQLQYFPSSYPHSQTVLHLLPLPVAPVYVKRQYT